jgi:hypothetical protein
MGGVFKMNITEKLMAMDPTLVQHNEGHWNEQYIEVPGGGTVGYSSFNDAGVEIEVGEFLYAMVRVLKPSHVLETGTHWGIGSAYMGQALKDNFSGSLDTLEFLPEIHERAKQRFAALDLLGVINPILMDAGKFNPTAEFPYQMMLLDTEPQTRFNELVRFFDCLTPGGYVFIHDLHRHMHQIENEEHGFAWPFGEIPAIIKEWVSRGVLRPFHFPTPRGLTGFYKPREDDYNWR